MSDVLELSDEGLLLVHLLEGFLSLPGVFLGSLWFGKLLLVAILEGGNDGRADLVFFLS